MACLRDFLPPVKGGQEEELSLNGGEEQGQLQIQASAIVGAVPPAQHSVTSTLTLPTDATGRPDFAAVVKQGDNASKYVHATRTSLVEKPRSAVSVAFPSEEEAAETERRTREALQKLLENKLKIVKKKDDEAKYIKYKPVNGTSTRIVKMVSAQADPMEPPRFSQKKAPMNPPSPPVPVLHSPERKLTKEEADEWKIPPVVSNWKNARGYTVPLDKRLAARGVQETPELSNRLAEFADALYQAERQARTDVEKRAQLQRAVSLRQKEEKEAQLRELAKRAREERSDAFSGARRIEESPPRPPVSLSQPQSQVSRDSEPASPPSRIPSPSVSTGAEHARRRRRSRFDIGPDGELMPEPKPSNGDEDDDSGVRERDAIRRERREQREREMRARENYSDTGPTLKRTKLTRDQDRDMAERVALGQGVAGRAAEVMYDQRLFNQGERDAGRAFGPDDGYNIYDKPLWTDRPGSSFLYRPKDATLGNQTVPKRGTSANVGERARGDRPVEFERDTEGDKEDPYGLDRFFDQAKRNSEK